ncbi:MAG: hypothetical protein AB1600_08200 [Bacteroidota bacterium]
MTIFKNIIASLLLFLLCSKANGQAHLQMRAEDRVRIAEAIKISKLYGEHLWPGINSVPFTLILVTDSVEFLINHPSPSNDFTLLNYDSLLASNIYSRKTTLGKNLLATFPAVKGVNTIVVGTPENTGKNSTEWIVTLLHEHFHQYTYSSPNYYSEVDSLGLSGGDQTGMWMLNYPFPYTDSTIVFRYKQFVSALLKCLADIDTKSFESSFQEYTTERRNLQRSLSPADYRYFSFQIWQEGLARYTEYKFLELLHSYKPFKELSQLPDFVPFDKYRAEFYQKQFDQLKNCSPELSKRICFYAVGFAEGLILDKLNPLWKDQYLNKKFYIERYSEKFNLQTR